MEKKLFLKVPALKGEVDSKTVFEDGWVSLIEWAIVVIWAKNPLRTFSEKVLAPLKEGQISKLLISNNIAMQHCTLGNKFEISIIVVIFLYLVFLCKSCIINSL